KLMWLLIAGLIFLCMFSCQKDEPDQIDETPTPTKIELRTGQQELVWFDSTGVFAYYPETDSATMEVVNLRNYDSIKHKTHWLSPSISPLQTECWEYNLRFYRDGQVAKEGLAFTKYKGIEYTRVMQPHEGWDSDVLYYTLTKTNTWNLYWVEECLKFKPAYLYIKRTFRNSGPPEVTQEYIITTSCTRHTVRYPLKFKR